MQVPLQGYEAASKREHTMLRQTAAFELNSSAHDMMCDAMRYSTAVRLTLIA
jgi:hypothetical protein